MRAMILATAASLSLVACADLSPTQQRALTGTVAGTAGGAAIGAIAGNAALGAGIGAAAGLGGGLLVDHMRRNEQRAFEQGVATGRQGG